VGTKLSVVRYDDTWWDVSRRIQNQWSGFESSAISRHKLRPPKNTGGLYLWNLPINHLEGTASPNVRVIRDKGDNLGSTGIPKPD